jgi:hypothetical protein
METTTNEIVVPEHYNPNQIVTYKRIDLETKQPAFVTEKVTQIEWDLEQMRHNTRVLSELRTQIRQLEGELESWLENANDADTIVSEICQIFGFNPEKEIQFEASATITGTIRVPLSQLSEFDIDDLDLTVYADAHGYDVDLDVEVDNIYKV